MVAKRDMWAGGRGATRQPIWRCFWCNAEFTNRAKAEIHFGSPDSDRAAPECYRLLQRETADLRAALEEVLFVPQRNALMRIVVRTETETRIRRLLGIDK